MKKILYIDLDGVVADYDANKKIFDKHNWSTKTSFFFMSMKPIDGAIEAVREFLLSKKYEVYFLSTAPWSNIESLSAKRWWIEHHFGHLAFKKLILTHNKGLLKGDYLIDDRTKNGVDKFEGEHIHFGQSKFSDWNKVLKYLKP